MIAWILYIIGVSFILKSAYDTGLEDDFEIYASACFALIWPVTFLIIMFYNEEEEESRYKPIDIDEEDEE